MRNTTTELAGTVVWTPDSRYTLRLRVTDLHDGLAGWIWRMRRTYR